eukprot:TRINITY_DN16528_c0_g2_i1.p1 TRINITY_DN16528_c0_g2~~TRINITY_DN16528_c0_g2_i1.p1  ORF type:complete len:266 (+),score=97.18 TRINITY_DN16528_c0_g2_i1:116-799(+)
MSKALPGVHYVLKTPYKEVPAGSHVAYFATGCFWGAEETFWKTKGVVTTAVGYQGGDAKLANYDAVCSGRSGHTEGVKVVYDPKVVSYTDLLKVFWQMHDPTQGDGQGNDRGPQYRSAVFTTTPEQRVMVDLSKAQYEAALKEGGHRRSVITTQVDSADDHPFHFAEEYHQQYLPKPGSRQYCSAQPTGIPLPAADSWLPSELKEHAPVLGDDVPGSRCAKGQCSSM